MSNLVSLRQKPSVAHGITQFYEDQGVTVVCYEPGNMTRYVLTFARIPPDSARLLAVDRGAMVVSDINRQTAYPFQPEGFLHYEYVASKLNREVPDAVVVTELIGYVMGRPVQSCEEYTAKFLATESS